MNIDPAIGCDAGRFRTAGTEQAVKIVTTMLQCFVRVIDVFSYVGEHTSCTGGFQDRPSGIVETQNPRIGGRGLHSFLCDTEERAHDHTVEPCAGVALGFGGFQNFFQCGKLTAGMHQAAPKTFRAVGECFEFFVCHSSQTVEYRLFSGGKRVDGSTVEGCVGIFGDARFPIVSVLDQLSYSRGGGIFPISLRVVIGTLPMNGQYLHTAVLSKDGFAVFNRQNIVGAAKEGGIQTHAFQCGLSCSGERFAGF